MEPATGMGASSKLLSTLKELPLWLLSRGRMQDFQELADEAFSDLLRKHGRPTDLKTALRQSAGTAEKSAVINPDFQKPRHRCDVGPSIASRRGRGILQRNEASEVGKQELPRN
jgi:hypothetical protein